MALSLDEQLSQLEGFAESGDPAAQRELADFKKWRRQRANGSVAQEPKAELSFVTASNVKTKRVDWLWKGRLARGKVTVLSGDPDNGKTTIAMALTACISTGRPFPGEVESREPQDVLIFGREDDYEDTTVPRLAAAGAALSRVHIEDINSLPMELPRDLGELERLINSRLNIGLIIIDPLLSYLGEKLNSYKDADVRRALIPLADLAKRTRVSILALMHNNKGGATNALHRIGGSIAFGGVARLGLLAEKDPDGNGYVLAPTKHNNCKAAPSLAYHIVEAKDDPEVGVISWGGESEHTATSLLEAQQERSRPGPKPIALDNAMQWLNGYLATSARKRSEVVEAAGKVKIPLSTLEKAARKLDVASVRSEEDPRERMWSLPIAGRRGDGQ